MSAAAESGPQVSVVIPHFENPRGLQRVIEAVRAQQGVGEVQIIVADDGSAELPEVGPGVRLVGQPDRGFRAAAARNLGAGEATGEVLVFLDGDTVPAPGCLAAFVERLRTEPEALVVGSRRHLVTDPQTGEQRDLGEPEWLAQAWRYTHDLREVDETGFRFVISAVLACRRAVFERIGGFDGSMVGYGGEDWELAWQAWLAGCELRHEPRALAWHEGVDWGDRFTGDEQARRRGLAQKNAETMALATRITHPSMRPAGVVWQVPDIMVRWGGEHDPAVVCAVVADLLGSGDVQVQLDVVPAVLVGDPRVQTSTEGPPAAARVRPRFAVELLRPCRVPTGALAQVCEQIALTGGLGEVVSADGAPLARITPRRSVARGEEAITRWQRDWPVVPAWGVRLEQEFRERGMNRLSENPPES